MTITQSCFFSGSFTNLPDSQICATKIIILYERKTNTLASNKQELDLSQHLLLV